jgi:hypothetical protein
MIHRGSRFRQATSLFLYNNLTYLVLQLKIFLYEKIFLKNCFY